MKITSAIFSACATNPESIPKGKPIIALVGRSNVGKSSLINVLACRKELAKTSSTPGKTLTLNFYEINESFYIVDLPGYGYAKASKVTRERIQKMMDEFFQVATEVVGIVQVLDIRHLPSTLDTQMFQWIGDQNIRHLLVLTKADKLGTSEVARMKRAVQKKLQTDGGVVFSCKTRQGREELLNCMTQLLSGGPVERRPGEHSGEDGSRFGKRRRPKSGRPQEGGRRDQGRDAGKEPGKDAGRDQGSETPAEGKVPGSPDRKPQEKKSGENPKTDQAGRHRRRHRKPRPHSPAGQPDVKNPKPTEGGS